jgi:monoamine oxidase
MSRTPLFAAVKKALAHAARENSIVLPRKSALTRRSLLRLSAAAAGAAALSPALSWNARAQKEPPSVGIVGGGVAGLTAAYRLQKAGAKPVLFEASNRWGGRMFTVYDFYKGMFCELGGELVDSNHEDLINLANELDVGVQRLDEDGGEDLYFFGDAWHMPTDMIDPKKRAGAFPPIAKQIGRDQAKLIDKHDNWTAYSRKLDNMSLKAYLDQFRGKTDDWAIDLLDVAYTINEGLEAEDQSCLMMVDAIATDMSEPFEIFGESDEAWRIKGGSSELIKALVAALENKVEMKQGYSLTALDYKDRKIVTSFDAPGGGIQTEGFDTVILALPFTKLRQVDGLERLKLGSEKLKCIRELGMGQSAKIMVGTTSRVWRTPASDLPAPSNGSFYSDLGFQNLWETSRAQPGEAGVLTDFLGGKAALTDAKSALEVFRSGLAEMSPKMAESLDPTAVTAFFWHVYPYTLGGYASAKVGQYTTMFEIAGEPALHGRLQFAGEHTSSDFYGYMNGAVESGNRAAAALIKQLGLKKQKKK